MTKLLTWSIEFSEFQKNFNSVHSGYIGTITRKINISIMKSQGKTGEQIKHLNNLIPEEKQFLKKKNVIDRKRCYTGGWFPVCSGIKEKENKSHQPRNSFRHSIREFAVLESCCQLEEKLKISCRRPLRNCPSINCFMFLIIGIWVELK